MKRLAILAVMIACVSLSGFAQAPACPSGTLVNVLGTTCSIGNLTLNFQNNFQGSIVIQDIFGNIQTLPLASNAIGITPVSSGNQAGFLLTTNFFDSTSGTGLIFSQHNITFSFSPQVNGAFEIVGESSSLVGNISGVSASSSDGLFAFDGRCFNNGQCMAVQPMVSSSPQNGQVNSPSVSSTIVPALSGVSSNTGFTTEVDNFAIGGGESTLNSTLFLFNLAPQTPLPPAARLKYKNIDLPGEQTTFAETINDRGEIVGAFQDSSGVMHGFLTDRDHDHVTVIDFANAVSTVANGINNKGEIVGQYTDNSGVTHGYLLKDGSFTTIDFPNSIFNLPAAINNRGDIAGFYENADASIHGYVLRDGAFITVDDPNAAVTTGPNNTPITQTELFSINDRGDVAGISFDANGFPQAFVLAEGVFDRITVPAAVEGTQVSSVNDSFDIIGAFVDVNLVNDGFLLRNGVFQTVDFPGAVNTFPSTINNEDQIVGFFSDATGAFHSFLAERTKPNDHSSGDASTATPASSAIANIAASKSAPDPCVLRQPMHPDPKTGLLACGPLH